MRENPGIFIGIDIGTSGCRACAIDSQGKITADSHRPHPLPERRGDHSEQHPQIWWQTTCSILEQLGRSIDGTQLQAIAVDATSGTVLLTDRRGDPLGPALMYDDRRARAEAVSISRLAPTIDATCSPSSSLAKVLHLYKEHPETRFALHQADWVIGKLSGCWGVSDENNCLKLGYDPIQRRWPDWLTSLPLPRHLFPHVYAPGTPIGTLDREVAAAVGLNPHARIVLGTTDSTAAFLATGAMENGEAVTSLGSTLVCKVIADQPVFAPEYGVYSHRIGNRWLAGGASNSGGAVLLKYFTEAQLRAMEFDLKPQLATGYHYYPLPGPGERFPVMDPDLKPQLTPRSQDPVIFYQAMLEGIAEIEYRGYRLLSELGAPFPRSVRTVGGGAKNKPWRQIRQRLLGVPFVEARQHEAAYGAALLARQAIC